MGITIAHELGHFVLHRARQGSFRCDKESVHFGLDTAAVIEREADEFASNILMPGDVLRDATGELVQDVEAGMLEALPPASSQAMVLARLGLPPTVRLPSEIQALFARAQGNPFFLEEIMRTLIDSSAVVLMMNLIRKEENSDSPIRTYSVGFARGEKVNETVYAKQVSELFGTEHKEFLIEPDVVKLLPKIAWHCDEPMADPALIPVYLLSEAAKKTSTVILTGDGGDELLRCLGRQLRPSRHYIEVCQGAKERGALGVFADGVVERLFRGR